MKVIKKLQGLHGKAQYQYYVKLLKKYEPVEYCNYDPIDFQYEDWMFLDANHNSCLVRSPGGSKTFDTVQWIILQKILHPEWKCAWLASQGGQLVQSRIYFEQHPFVKKIKQVQGYDRIYLWNDTYIHFRNCSKSITGIRLDVIVLDEEEMLDPMQVEIVYPQLEGRLTNSHIDKFVHLGTMQTGTLFHKHTIDYPTKMRIWEVCPWLIKAGKIQREIDAKVTPKHIIDMLYYCIPSTPGGAILPRLEKGTVPANVISKAGTDHGNKDVAVLTWVENNILYVIGEYERVLLDRHDAFDFLKDITSSVEAEGGGYNDDAKYDAKASLLAKRIGARKQPWTLKWAQQRLMVARTFDRIVVDPQLTPNVWNDLFGGQYDPRNGNIWFKHTTKAPCHWLDAFMHSLHNTVSAVDIATPINHKSLYRRDTRQKVQLA